MADKSRGQMTRREQHIGRGGENIAAATLRQIGVLQVEKIGTPVHLIPVASPRKNVYQVIFGEKVSGDHRGVLPGGRSVLAETKTILDRPLCWSDLRDHQPERLTNHHEAGGLSLLVWVHETGVFVLRWPIPGFGPRKSIALDYARGHMIEDVTQEGWC
jgi:hypothetical protein